MNLTSIFNLEPATAAAPMPAPAPAPVIPAAAPAAAGKFQIIDYSDKAIAVTGDTKAIKDDLKALGGRFNPRLKCGAGWIFSKKKQQALEKLLNMQPVN